MPRPNRYFCRLGTIFCLTGAFSLACRSDNLRAPHSEQAEHFQVAEFLAGHTLLPTSPFYERSQKPFFQRHQTYMLRLKEQIFNRHVSRIEQWKSENQFKAASRTAVYLLSGADVPNLMTFFPDCKQYLMVALQPAAEIGNLTALSDAELDRSLEKLRVTMQDIAKRNYFRSAVLRKSKKNTGLPGIAPILLSFLATLNKEVVAYENVVLDNDGKLIKTETDTATGTSGFRIYFREPGDLEIKTLVYLCLKVDPDFILTSKPEGKLFAGFGQVNLMLKAAIYLFHEEAYTNLATELLRKSDLVLQDDSGIPTHYFPRDEWKFSLFGVYSKSARLNDMKRYKLQDDLRDLYALNSRPLNFSFGYGSWSGRSNLMWASRIKSAR